MTARELFNSRSQSRNRTTFNHSILSGLVIHQRIADALRPNFDIPIQGDTIQRAGTVSCRGELPRCRAWYPSYYLTNISVQHNSDMAH